MELVQIYFKILNKFIIITDFFEFFLLDPGSGSESENETCSM